MRFVNYILCAGLLICGSLQLANAQDAGADVEIPQGVLEFLKTKPVPKEKQLSKATPRSTSQTGSSRLKSPASRISQTEFSAANYTDLTRPPRTPLARLQKGQRTHKLESLDGLEFTRFARRLGEISSISRGVEGQLYITDMQSGRVFMVPDQNQDGRPEQIRPLPYRFDTPSAAIEIGENLYIADREAIWKVPKARISSQAPVVVASLRNIQSVGQYFLVSENSNALDIAKTITLGYTSRNGKLRLISIDIETGRAVLKEETDGDLQQLVSASGGAKPWAAYRTQDGLKIGTDFGNAADFGTSLTVNGMALPYAGNTPEDWPKALRGHVFISRSNPVNVTALPTSLGIAAPRGIEVFTGFQNGRTAWGSAGALHMDKRGLFIADPFNGDLWLLKPETKTKKTAGQNRVNLALDRLKAARELEQQPLKRDPLDGIYDSQFDNPKARQESNAKAKNKP